MEEGIEFVKHFRGHLGKALLMYQPKELMQSCIVFCLQSLIFSLEKEATCSTGYLNSRRMKKPLAGLLKPKLKSKKNASVSLSWLLTLYYKINVLFAVQS